MTYYTLHEIVTSLQVYSRNMDYDGYVSLREIAMDLWWKMSKKTREAISREWHEVVNGKIRWPKGMDELLSVIIVDDCGDQRALYTDNIKNTFKNNTVRNCKCGSGSYEDIPVTETVTINGNPYKKLTVTRIQGSSIYKHESVPVASYKSDGAFDGVVMNVSEYKVCDIETNGCGCPAQTPENETKLCGCGFKCDPSERVFFRVPPNEFGYYKNDYDEKVIHVFDKHGKPSKMDSALLVFMGQTESLLVPQYCKMPLIARIEATQKRFNPLYLPGEADAADRYANRMEFEMKCYLHPFQAETTTKTY